MKGGRRSARYCVVCVQEEKHVARAPRTLLLVVKKIWQAVPAKSRLLRHKTMPRHLHYSAAPDRTIAATLSAEYATT